MLLLLPVFLQCGQKEMSLPIIEVSENQHFLMNENGEPFFWLGDTGWLLFSKLDRNEAEKYLSNRVENGFNVIQVMVLHQLELTYLYNQCLVSR